MTDFWGFLMDISSKCDIDLGGSSYSMQDAKSSSDDTNYSVEQLHGVQRNYHFTHFDRVYDAGQWKRFVIYVEKDVLPTIFFIAIVPSSTAKSQFIVLKPITPISNDIYS